MNQSFKVVILVSSLVVTLFLVMEAWRENLNMDWQRYQQKYKDELMHLAQSEQDRTVAKEYSIELRQIVLPHLNKSDRCVTCHVAMEDSRMSEMENPLKAHPGDYLEKHDINKVGCTSCHDGQGLAISADDAHGRGMDKFWEKPLLDKPYLEANCVRCHVDTLSQTPHYNTGKRAFKKRGCFACHSVGDIGGAKGPALSDIGDASFHVKMPIHENREELMHKFNQNVNLAYLYEAIVEPAAQPEDSKMAKIEFSEEEVTGLMVYLKSLSSDQRFMDIGASDVKHDLPVSEMATTSIALPAPGTGAGIAGTSNRGFAIFRDSCSVCHTIGKGDLTGPDLKGVTARREETWLKDFIQYPSKMFADKDPIAMQLLEKYGDPMIDMGLTDEEVEEVIKYLKNPEAVSIADAAKTTAAEAPKVGTGATRAEIQKGMRLFEGTQRFLNGGASCISCHDVRSDAIFAGGSLAKELTTSHSRLRDAGLRGILKKPPFPEMKEAYKDQALTDDEINALVAFLADADQEQGNKPAVDYQSKMVGMGLGGLIALFILMGSFGFRKRKHLVNKAIYDRQKKSED